MIKKLYYGILIIGILGISGYLGYKYMNESGAVKDDVVNKIDTSTPEGKIKAVVEKMQTLSSGSFLIEYNIEATMNNMALGVSMGLSGEFYNNDVHMKTNATALGMAVESEVYGIEQNNKMEVYSKTNLEGGAWKKEESSESVDGVKGFKNLTELLKNPVSIKATENPNRFVVEVSKETVAKLSDSIGNDDMSTSDLNLVENIAWGITITDDYFLKEIYWNMKNSIELQEGVTYNKAYMKVGYSNFNSGNKIVLPNELNSL